MSTVATGPVASGSVDPDDGDAVWGFPVGTEVLPGVLAVENLGVGYRCETWLVWLVDGWHPAVLKLPRPHQVDHPRARSSLQRELAGLTAGAGHPAYPRLLGDRTQEAVPHLLMEYLDGTSLADLVDDEGALSEAEAAVLGAALLPALVTLHRSGRAHVDVKSENVLIRDGRPYLVDFGSSRELGAQQPAGRPVGTTGYVAPEMEACEPIAVPMDLFGLGTVLHEALTGTPFTDHAPLPPGELTPVVERLLDPDPLRRGTPPEILRDLVAFLPEDDRPWPAWMDAHLGGAAGR